MAINQTALSDEQRNAFTIAYRFYEKYHAMDGEPEDWRQAAEDIGKAYCDAGQTDLAQRLLMAIFDAMDAAQKAREDAERNAPEQTVMTDADGRPVIMP